MEKRIRHILVALGDVGRAPGGELHKASALARASGASIELFHALAADGDEKSRAAAETKSRNRLERFARAAPLRGLRVKCTTVWDYPAHEAIIRRALTSGADLVIAATHPRRLGGRLLLRNTDWELIRQCPTAVLLVKSNRQYRKPAVLAAIDPFHAHARPADLDPRLLAIGNTFAHLLHGTLHAFHAYMPLIAVAPLAGGAAPFIVLPPEAEEAHGRVIARAIDELADATGVPPACRHVQMGDVTGQLTATVKRTRASLVVMGAVSRSALARLLIGNTAERVLDRLSCDVLIVKPRGFKSRVARRQPVKAASTPTPTRSLAGRATLPPLF